MAARSSRGKKKSVKRTKKQKKNVSPPDTAKKKKKKTSAIDQKEESKIAVFQVGKEVFAFNLDSITETLYTFTVTSVPHLPDVYHGVIKLHGKSLPVVSLRQLLRENGAASSDAVCVIVDLDGDRMGFIVDSDIEIVPERMGSRYPLPDCYTLEETEFIEGIFRWDERFIGILNPRRMMETLAGWRHSETKK